MLLAIDVGNTNTVIGVYEGQDLTHHWRVRTERNATEDEFHLLIKGLLSSEGAAVESVSGTIISCVVPPMINNLNSFCTRYLGQY